MTTLGEATLAALYPPADDEDTALAKACAADLPVYIPHAWPVAVPGIPFVSNWHIDTIAYHLQAVSEGELPRLIVNQPPRTSKSLTSAVLWPSWEWLTDATVQWIYASYAQTFAYRDSLKMRRLLESEGNAMLGPDANLFQRLGYRGVLKLLGKDWSLTDDQNTKGKYETTVGGARFATSVGGVATGEGGDRIVVDDPINAKQSRSEALRDAANIWWDETMSTRFNNSSAAAVIVMQRLHEEDLSGHLLAAEDSEWHHLCLPATFEPAHQFRYPEVVTLPSGRELQGDTRTEPGESLDKVRLDDKTLNQRRRSLGTYGYAGQFDQTPVPAKGGMFHTDWWQTWTPGFEGTLRLGWDAMIQSWDMRFKDDKASGDWVVGQLWGFHGADAYLLGQVRGRFSFVETVAAVQALNDWVRSPEHWLRTHQVGLPILIEEAANGPAVRSQLARKVQGMVPVRPVDSKVARAASCTPAVEAGNVFLPPGDFIPCPKGYDPTTVSDFTGELARFPLGSHDDQVDAFSQAWNHRKPVERRAPVQSRRPVVRSRTGGLRDRAARGI